MSSIMPTRGTKISKDDLTRSFSCFLFSLFLRKRRLTQRHWMSFFLACFLTFFFCCNCSIWMFLGQGSNENCSFDLCHSSSNTRFLTYYARLGIETMHHRENVGSLTRGTTAGIPLSLAFNYWVIPSSLDRQQRQAQMKGYY